MSIDDNLKPFVESGYAHAHDHLILPEGYRCNRLGIVKWLGSNRHSKFVYLCRCDCGSESRFVGSVLRNKLVMGCSKCQRHKAIKIAQKIRMEKYLKHFKKRNETILSLVGQIGIKQIGQFVGLSHRSTAQIIQNHRAGEGKGCPGKPKTLEHRRNLSLSRARAFAPRKEAGK